MRTVSLAALALMLIGASPPKPAFEYKSFRAGEVIPDNQLLSCSVLDMSAKSREEMTASFLNRLGGSKANEPGVTDDEKLRALKAADFSSCSGRDSKVAGLETISESIILYRARLTSVSLMANALYFGRITDALKAKYGTPCQSGLKPMQNGFGARFQSPFYVWCFAGGKLRADMYYPDRETMNVEYKDAWQPPKVAPRVDF